MFIRERNPKQKQSRSKNDSKSRLRYEKYKAAVTLRDAKRMGASFADLRWDFIHGFIDFGEARDPQVQEAAIRKYRNRHPNVKYGGFVNSAEELVSSTDTPHLTVDDAVRSEYDLETMFLDFLISNRNFSISPLAEEEKQHLFSLLPAVRLGLCSKTLLRYGRLLLDRTPPNGKLPSTKK